MMYFSSYTSYTDSYSESYTYSTGSLTDSREYDEPITLPEVKSEVNSETTLSKPDNKQDEPDPISQSTQVQSENDENNFDSSFADVTIIEAPKSAQVLYIHVLRIKRSIKLVTPTRLPSYPVPVR